MSDLDGQDKKNYLLQFVGLTKFLNIYNNLAKLINIRILLTMLKPEELNGHIFFFIVGVQKVPQQNTRTSRTIPVLGNPQISIMFRERLSLIS